MCQRHVAHPPSRFQRRSPADPFARRDQSLAFAVDDAWTPPDWFGHVHVVLFEPTDPVNIGVVLRAMANTGFSRLRLANPAPFDPWDVIGVAHYTQHLLEATAVFGSLPEAVADLHLVLALTGKHQRSERNVLPFADAVRQAATSARAGRRVGLVFGREDYGLTNAALDSCQVVTTIPTNPAHPSLNLAQATLLVLYELFRLAGGTDQALRPARRVSRPATAAELEDLFADLERALAAFGYLRKRSPLVTMRSLRTLLDRAYPSAREAALLRSIALDLRRYLHRHGLLDEVGPIGRAPG
jgi:TrmH family RNA methyltransferase